MKQHYNSSKSSSPQWNRLWRMLLIIFLLTAVWQKSWGDHYIESSKMTLVNYLSTSGYIEFSMPVYEWSNSDEGIPEAVFKVSTTDGSSWTDIFRFRSTESESVSWSSNKEGEYNVSESWQEHTGTKAWVEAWMSAGTSSVGHVQLVDIYDNRSGGNKNNAELTSSKTRKYMDQEAIGSFQYFTAKWRWYPPEGFIDKNMKIEVEALVDYNSDGHDAFKLTKDMDATAINFSTPKITSVLSPYSESPNTYYVNYSGISEGSYQEPLSGSQFAWDNVYENSTSANGNKYFNISNKQQTHTASYKYKLNQIYNDMYLIKTETFTLAPFRQASNGSVTSLANGNSKVTWSITDTDANDDLYTTDNFEIQRSTKADFSQNLVTLDKVAFSQTKASYELTDNTGDYNLNGTVYYRIRREKANVWQWAGAYSFNSSFNMQHRGVASASATLTPDGSSIQINWKMQPVSSNHSVWTEGSKVNLLRTDQNNNATLIIEIPDTATTSYTDKNLQMCHVYTYTVYVQPAITAYSATTKIDAVSNGQLIPTLLAEVKSITASKGYYPNYTRIEWTTDGNATDQFNIERKLVGDSDDKYQIAGTATAEQRLFDDEKGSAGNIYVYRVVATSNCNGKTISNPSVMTDRGFRSPTGAVSGQINFGYGDAVANADVRVTSKTITRGNSFLYAGNNDSYLDTDSTIAIPAYASLQAFIKPTTANQTAMLLSWGRYQVGLSAGKLTFSANGGTVKATSPEVIPTDRFSQITLTHASDSLRIYIDSTEVANIITAGNEGATTTAKVIMGKGFKGYIDEIRLWNRALNNHTQANTNEIEQTYNRILAGNEENLCAYWRFNDPVSDEFYDLSYSGETHNANHGKVHNAVLSKNTDEIPTESQLCLRGLTDKTGYYRISGIPYEGTSSTYTLTPFYPNHTFEPTSKTIDISATQPTFSDVNFTDKSAILISGYVFYENSTIPVKDATFEIGGTPVTSNGDYVRSGTDGSFKFSVPAGEQTVRIVKTNHTFANNGLLQDSKGLNFNFQQPIANLRFWDRTKVKLIGRVAGGTKQESYPLGFSLSKNNLGDSPKIVMTLEGDNTSYIVNSDTPVDSTMNHYDGKHQNQVHYAKQQITIKPNVETGEYVAMMYPVKYKIIEISATGYNTLFPNGTSSATLDLSNKFTEQTSDYTDTVSHKSLSISYNEKYNRIYRNNTSLTYKQYRDSQELEYFGDLNYNAEKLSGTQTINLYNDKTKLYLFGYPVFHSTLYKMKVSAHEDYYYNNVKSGPDIKIDAVNLNGGIVKISNGFKAQAVPFTAELDSLGETIVNIIVDNVPFSLQGVNALRTLDMAMSIDGQNVQATQLKAYLLGSRSQGKDYVTGGPINLMYILRDPPGSNSYSYLQKGVTTSYNYSSSTGVKNEGNISLLAAFGVTKVVGIGAVGLITNSAMELDNNVGAKIHNEESGAWGNSYGYSMTTTTSFKTSDNPAYVGADGDVFIGTTSNLTYGPADNVGIIAKDMYNAAKNTQSGSTLTVIDQTTDGQYYLVNNIALAINKDFNTMFAYPQKHIEEVLIPNIERVRNSFLLKGITEQEAQQRANSTKQWVYLSLLDSTDSDYGKDNLDGNGNYIGISSYNIDSLKKYLRYKIIEPNAETNQGDTIFTLNQSIKEWQRVLKLNEQEKITATTKLNNYSFHSGSPIEYAESYSYSSSEKYNFDLYIAAGVSTEFGFAIDKHGFAVSIEETVGATNSIEHESTTTENRTSGFVLADEGTNDYLSVDVYRIKAVQDSSFYDEDKNKNKDTYGNFIFKTMGGATSCPHEDKRVSKYYYPGTTLSESTQQIEKPVLMVDNPVVSNIPSNETAKFNLKLYSESETKSSGVYTLALVDWQNQHGAKFSIDGVPLSDGRSIEIPFGDVLNKVLEVGRGTDYDYDNLALVLRSQCDDNITDTVYLSAHFIPSSSDINIKSPTDKWTLNTNSPLDSITGKYYMPVTIDGFDVNFTGFDHIELQYKATSESDTKWTTICSYYTDSAKFKVASGEKAMITGSTIGSRFFGAEDQKYDMRAVSFSKVGNDFVTKTSTLASGTKDTKRPVVFGNVQPADGILDVEDELKVTFNEEIAEGVMTNVKNFEVTAIRNGTNTDHSTSLTFDGKAAYLVTQAERNLNGKSFSIEMWVLPASLGQKMTLFSHGSSANAMELSIGANNSIQVQIGDKTYSSLPQAFKTTDWAHVAMTYNATSQQLDAYFGGQAVITGVNANKYTGSGVIYFGRGVNGDNLFAGKMHEARVWDKVVSESNIIANKLTIYTGQELGMMDYYPMNEGKGMTVTDKAQGATAWIKGATWSTLDGMSMAFDGKSIAKINSSRIAITDEMNYTLEFWFKAGSGQTDAALVSNGKGIGDESNTSYNKVFIGFENGKLIFRNNGDEETVDGNYLDNIWHHFAITVNRNAGNAQIFIDGALKSYFDANKLGGMSAPSLNLGARFWVESSASTEHTDMYLNGQIDELQLWNMALQSTYIADKYNVCPNGKEMGLMTYLPFSKYIINSANAQELVYSGEDIVSDSTLVTLIGAVSSMEKAPVRAKGPEVSIPFNFVVNKDALIINLTDTPEALEKTTVNITVKDVIDLNGNLMLSPVTWSAYINQNQLKWSESSVSKEKKVNTAMTFNVDVENIGGSIKNYSIVGLPAWLTAFPESGSLDPLGRETITFTINEGINIGKYDEIVYVKGDNNVTEALPITLKVFDKQPDWGVNPEDYKFSMNVYGRIRVNDVFSTDQEDVLAAFDSNGNCIGKSNNQYLKINDMWYVFMSIYNNEKRFSNPEFRIWDASSGVIYSATSDNVITFVSDTVIGSVSNPVIFNAKTGITQDISLKSGWNWVSFNVASNDLSNPTSLLKKISFSGDEQIKDETNGTFAAYSNSNGSWIGDKITFDNKHMFLIQSGKTQKLSVSGNYITDKDKRTLNITKGWNYISYIPTANLQVSEALSSYEAKEGDIIKSQNAFSMYGTNIGWVGSLTYMEPGKGYMMFSTNGGSLIYPDLTGNATKTTTRANGAMNENVLKELSNETNMSMVATVADNLPLQAGDKLLAYAGNEICGVASLNENPINGNPLYFITVGVDSNASVSFGLERAGQIIGKTSPLFDYHSNAVRGTIEQPIILDFVNNIGISVYPNPFDSELNFDMNVVQGDNIRIMLYSLTGRLLYNYDVITTTSGYWHHRWQCTDNIVSTLYMAVVSINGEKHVYKVRKK